MAWVKLDDQFFRNRKARAVGKDGRSLFLASCCYAAAGLTDGFIPKGDIAVLCADAEVRAPVAKKLVDAGLWHEVDGGWQIHDFTDMNPTAEEVKERRRQAKERQTKWRQRKNASRNASRDGVSHGHPVPGPARPEGSRAGLSEEPSAMASSPAHGGDDEPERDAELNVTNARAARALLRPSALEEAS